LSSDLRKNVRKRAGRPGETALVRMLEITASTLPRRTGLSLFTFLGSLSYRLFRRDRERAVRNIALAFPTAPRVVVEAIAKGAFRSLGRNALDTLRLKRCSRERVLESCLTEGEENLRQAFAEGRGVIALTGHIGCWELLTAYFSDKGYKVGLVTERLRNKRLDGMMVSIRRRHGVSTIYKEDADREGREMLERGEILGMMADRSAEADGIMAPFFGQPALTSTGPAALALEAGAEIVPMAISMQPYGTHQITVLSSIAHPPRSLPDRERLAVLTRACAAAVERLVRLYPQQWLWFHDRWKARAEDLEKDGESGYLEVDGTA
jgi:KDO2-lipid IV(A) lauroyltransferase